MEPDPAAGAVAVLSHPEHCPPWCIECDHDQEPPGTVLHRGATITVVLYGEACELVTAHIRPCFWDTPPGIPTTEPADLEHPHIEATIPSESEGDVPRYLTTAQARTIAAAILSAAAAVEATEARPRVHPCR